MQQARTFLRAHARNVFQPAAPRAHAGTGRAHAGDGKAVCFVADLGDQHQRSRVLAEVDLLAPVGKHQLFQAHLASLALLDTDDARDIEAQRGEHLARHADLALAAINQHQVGQARTARRELGTARFALRLSDLAVTPLQHLAHGGVVVTSGDAINVEAAVLAALHLVVLKHHARRLGGFARRMRDVETLNAQEVQIVLRQVQRLRQRAGAGLLRAFFGKQAGQLQLRVVLCHIQPGTALLARLVHSRNPHARLHAQRVEQAALHRFAGDEHRRHRYVEVVLGDEGLKHQHLHRQRYADLVVISALLGIRRLGTRLLQRGRIVHMHGKVSPVAQMPAPAHHRQVDAGAPALHTHSEDVHVLVARCLHRLLVQHARERRDLVAHLRRLLKLQPLGVRQHALLQSLHHRPRFAAQQGFGMGHVLGIGFGRNQAHTGRAAAFDLVEKARTRAVGKHRVFAGAQAKHLLQQQNRFLHRPAARVGAEVAVLFVGAAAVVGQARKALAWVISRAVFCRDAGDF